MFSENFGGACPLCRTEIVSHPQTSTSGRANEILVLAEQLFIVQKELAVGKAALLKIMRGTPPSRWWSKFQDKEEVAKESMEVT